MSLRPERQLLRQKSGSTLKLKLVIKKSYLRLLYVSFMPALAAQWKNSIRSLGLHRSIQLCKSTHITVAKGSHSVRGSNIFSSLVVPQTMVFFFTKENVAWGNSLDSRFVFRSQDVTQIKIFKNGKPCQDDTVFSSMETKKRNSFTHYALYRNFLSCFGDKAKLTVDLESFFENVFVYCVNLSADPRVNDEFGIMKNAEERRVSFVESAVLDIDVTFGAPVDDNYVLFFLGFYDSELHFNDEGLVITG